MYAIVLYRHYAHRPCTHRSNRANNNRITYKLGYQSVCVSRADFVHIPYMYICYIHPTYSIAFKLVLFQYAHYSFVCHQVFTHKHHRESLHRQLHQHHRHRHHHHYHCRHHAQQTAIERGYPATDSDKYSEPYFELFVPIIIKSYQTINVKNIVCSKWTHRIMLRFGK